MATSYSFGKKEISEYLKRKYTENARVLDVGAGEGTYYNYLGDYFEQIDAVEIFEKNIIDYDLKSKYKNVYNCNIVDFNYEIFGFYDIIIFGDILEHLSVIDAQKVLNDALEHCDEIIVAVPYNYKQGIEYGNIYEIHIQDDLTEEIMKQRYPQLKLYLGDEKYGYYIRKEE